MEQLIPILKLYGLETIRIYPIPLFSITIYLGVIFVISPMIYSYIKITKPIIP